MPTPKILIAVPAFGQIISATTFLTTHQLMSALQQKGIGVGISTLSYPDIAELRGMYATIFHDTMDCTHILFVDADMGFTPDLVFDQLLLDEPLVGAIYPQRRLPQSWAGSGNGEPTTERRGSFMEVEGIGFGCTLIRRDCLAKMLEAYPELVDTRLKLHPAFETLKSAGATRLFRFFEKMDIPERGLVSEDLSFCLRWRKIGGRVWAAISHRISHVGPYDYAGRYLDQWELAERNAAQAATVQSTLGGTPQLALPQTNATPAPPPVLEVIQGAASAA